MNFQIESIINILTGLLCILFGILIIMLYREGKKEKQSVSFRLQNAGIMLVIIGIGLLIREIRK